MEWSTFGEWEGLGINLMALYKEGLVQIKWFGLDQVVFLFQFNTHVLRVYYVAVIIVDTGDMKSSEKRPLHSRELYTMGKTDTNK